VLNLNSPQKEDWPWLPAWTCWMVVPAMDIASFNDGVYASQLQMIKQRINNGCTPHIPPSTHLIILKQPLLWKQHFQKRLGDLAIVAFWSTYTPIITYTRVIPHLYPSYTPAITQFHLSWSIPSDNLTVCYGFHSKLRVRSTNKWVRFHHSCRNYMIYPKLWRFKFHSYNHYQPSLTIISHHQPSLTIISHYQPLITTIDHYENLY